MKNPLCLILIASVLSIGCRDTLPTADYPARPVKVVVPFGAGGGSDTFGRIIQKAIEDEGLLAQKLVIINVPGAGGTIGSRRVKNARPDGYTLLLLHEGMMTAKFGGQAAYGPEAFTAIAGSGDATQVIVVDESSPYKTLADLMDDSAKRPEEIVFAANIGAPSQFAGLMLEREKPGAKFLYTPTGGGSKRFHALKGGHVDVSAFSISEYVQFRSSGLRAISLLGAQRHPEVTEVPTAREQGFDVISQNMQFWWAPKGTDPGHVEVIADAIEKAMNTDFVRQKLSQMRIDPRFVKGSELEAEIELRSERISSVSSRDIAHVPNVPMFALWSTLALGVLTVFAGRRRKIEGGTSGAATAVTDKVPDRWMAFQVGALTIVFVACLAATSIGFRPLTFVFVLATGAVVALRPGKERTSARSTFISLGILALIMSFGVHFLFTRVLVVDLP